ncbi:MAG TPA: hypothetical protein VLK82_01110 [Candidatus Tectomicrobia bacterium]|nr:hypothetical protein [Candidatus Tectomicrobia bacterium]
MFSRDGRARCLVATLLAPREGGEGKVLAIRTVRLRPHLPVWSKNHLNYGDRYRHGGPIRTRFKDVRELIRMMRQANPTWGLPRIVGELQRLDIDVAKSTVEMHRVPPCEPLS